MTPRWLRPTAFERRGLSLVFETLVPSGQSEQFPRGAGDFPLDRFLDDLADHAPARVLLGLRACLWLVILCPPFVLRRLSTFFGLAAAERIALMLRLKESPIYLVREIPLLFKTMACLAVCGLAEVQAPLGIEPRDESPPSWLEEAS